MTMSNLENTLRNAYGISVVLRRKLISAYNGGEGARTAVRQLLLDNTDDLYSGMLPELLALADDEDSEPGPMLRRAAAVAALKSGPDPDEVDGLLETVAVADRELAARFPTVEQLAAGYQFRPGTVVTFNDKHDGIRLVATYVPGHVAEDGTLHDLYWTDPWGGSFSIEDIAAGSPTVWVP